VDNASSDDSVSRAVRRFPQVEVIHSPANRGFAGGNNLGWDHIRRTRPGVRYLALLNQDTIVTSGWLNALVGFLERHPRAGCAQSRLMLYPQTQVFNSAGNRSHFLGFGFTTGYGEHDRQQYDQPRTIDFPSGAACVVRTELLHQLGLFDEAYFLYMEDAELGWKLRLAGYDTVYVPDSIVYHKYGFGRNPQFYYYVERNRWWLLLTYYRMPTLLLLMPALVVMEAGQLFFAARSGHLQQKLRGYGYFVNRHNLRRLRRTRRAAQQRRVAGDAELMAGFSGTIISPELTSPLLRYLANPFFAFYWRIVRRLIVW
jgi:GT2 family glycosyltransferase